MRIIAFILLLLLTPAFMQGQFCKPAIVVGVQAGAHFSAYRASSAIQYPKIGISNVSYTATVESRLTLHNQLKFTLQYSLSFYSFLSRPIQYKSREVKNDNLKEPSMAFSAFTMLPIKDDLLLFTGGGVQLQSCQKNKNVNGCFFSENACNSFNQFIANPYFLFGLEYKARIFKKSMIFSIQNNLGFLPGRVQYESNNGNILPVMQGIQIGMKYQLP